MKIPYYQIDAFSSSVFGGNPAAVCPLDNWLDDLLLQAIAAENNLAETAFFVRKGDHFELRWFMPHDEIDLCGHATLASAFVIFNWLDWQSDEILFQSQSGPLKATQNKDRSITLDFPAWKADPIPVTEIMTSAFGLKPKEAYANRDLILLYDNEDQIRMMNPNLTLLKDLPYLCLIPTALGQSADFVSRVFDANAPEAEDPVTGSAHTSLVPFWAKKTGKTIFHARQLSARGGELFCELKNERVYMRGHAVHFMTGEILLTDKHLRL
ncbi:MAG: PhzF family phenazine biosynthesis protein [Bacteroidota bacterium]